MPSGRFCLPFAHASALAAALPRAELAQAARDGLARARVCAIRGGWGAAGTELASSRRVYWPPRTVYDISVGPGS